MKTLIEVQNIYKSYGALRVLNGLNLKVFDGETLVILGRSGVGKSVLLRLLMGLEEPDSGSIIIDKEPLQAHKPNLRIPTGMLFQGAALFDSMTIGENIEFALRSPLSVQRFGHLENSVVKENVLEVLSAVGLEGTENKMPANLSGGMKKRAALARLIALRPHILLYDEPTTGLDPITAMQINKLICKTQENLHSTSIVVTHDLESALTVGDRLALHDGGQIIYCDSKINFINSSHPSVKAFLAPRLEVSQTYKVPSHAI